MVKSADRVFQILETIGLDREGITHGELSAKLRIPKSSLTSLLANLVTREYLSLDSRGRRYRLGPGILLLAGRYLQGLDLVRLGYPLIRRITGAIDESAEIAVKRGDEIMIICKEDCSRPLGRIIQIGDRAPIYATAAGKVILAHLSEQEINQYISTVALMPITKKTITDPEILRRELAAIRAGSLGLSHEEMNEGITAMASPVFDLQRRVVASIVLPIPTVRFSPEKEKTAGGVLRRSAMELSRQLGYDDGKAPVAEIV